MPVLGPAAPPGWRRVFIRSYPGVRAQVRQARADAARVLAGFPAASDAISCLGETAANAVRHSRSGAAAGMFVVSIELFSGGQLLVTVTDEGGLWAGQRPGNEDDVPRGHGLDIVRELSAEMGINGNDITRSVWFACDWGHM